VRRTAARTAGAKGKADSFAALAIGLAVVIVIGLIINGVRIFTQQERAQAWRIHTYDVIVTTKDLMLAMERGQTGERGFLLTGRTETLEPFNQGAAEAPKLLRRLAVLTADDAGQQARVAAISRAALPLLQRWRDTIDRARNGNLAAEQERYRNPAGPRPMPIIRAQTSKLLAEEQHLLAVRSDAALKNARTESALLYVLSILALVLTLIAGAAALSAANARARLRVTAVEQEAQEDLRQAHDFLQMIIDGAPDPIYVKDRKGRFVLANSAAAAVYGASREDMIGKTDADLAPPAVAEPLMAQDRRIMDNGVAEIVDDNVPIDGRDVFYTSSKAPWIREGKVIGLIGISRDITERMATQRQLESLNQDLELRVEARSREIEQAESRIRQMQRIESIGQLTGGIAHDFNNMLAIVIGSLDLADRKLESDPSKARQAIANALDGAERAAALTSRLLAFSRQQPLAPVILDPSTHVAGMIDLLRRTLGEHIKVETRLADDPWPVLIDREELGSAIVNLCVNARDAMLDGGRLAIETRNEALDEATAAEISEAMPGMYAVIEVTDTGAGMSPEVLQRAFDPFYTTKTVGKGTGLGLSQVHGFIRQSGGFVRLASTVGEGTRVSLYLPRQMGAAIEPATPPMSSAPSVARPGEIVLVVEDEPGVRTVSVSALRELGYTVLHASGGDEAIDHLNSDVRIDLLFTDVVMPDMNGRQLAERALAIRPKLRVLYTTGYARDVVPYNGAADAEAPVLGKPFTVDQLSLKVREVLDA